MKNLLALAITLTSLASFANTVDSVYRRNSALPAPLKTKVLSAISAKCQKAFREGTLLEQMTTMEVKIIDQGVRDKYFTSEFSLSIQFQEHPIYYRIQVVSIEADITNPSVDKYDIKSVNGDANICSSQSR